MAPKSLKGKHPATAQGRTKQQQEKEELEIMTRMSAELYEANHKKSTGGGKGAKKAALADPGEMSLEVISARKEKAKNDVQEAHLRLLKSSTYVNEVVPLEHGKEWTNIGGTKWVRFDQFQPAYLDRIVDLLTKSLSEPYNCFTYEYFFSQWPDVGLVGFGVESEEAPSASVQGEIIGTCVSKVSRAVATKPLRGYIAMLAVEPAFRGFRLGQKLVTMTVELMKKKKVEEIVLETPTSNTRALNLYTSLGFAKTKFLYRYYLDGQDAVRLKLWLWSALEGPEVTVERRTAYSDFQRALDMLSITESFEKSMISAASSKQTRNQLPE